MKSLKNSIQLFGNLGMNPEVKTLSNGKKVTTLSLATTETYKNAKGERMKDTQWHKVVAWGKLAELMETYLKKGSEVAIEGKLVYKNYQDKNGVTKYFSEIVANEMIMIGRKTGEKENLPF